MDKESKNEKKVDLHEEQGTEDDFGKHNRAAMESDKRGVNPKNADNQSSNTNWHKYSAIAQVFVALVMLLSLWYSMKNQESFEKFQYAILRPVVYIDLAGYSWNINEGAIETGYTIHNCGSTPALNLAIITDLDSLPDFPEIAPTDTMSTIFPYQEGILVVKQTPLLTNGQQIETVTQDQVRSLFPIYYHIKYI